MSEKADNTYLKKFGKKLKELKKESNLSYRKIATKCNLDFSDIKRYEDGEINVTLESIAELAKGYSKHPKKLFDFDWGSEFPPDEEEVLKKELLLKETQINAIEEQNKKTISDLKKEIQVLTKMLKNSEKKIEKLNKKLAKSV